MGYWFPTINITGGLYGGMQTPGGDMSGFIERASKNVVGNYITLSGDRDDRYSVPDPDAEWPGAFGSSPDKIKTLVHGDDQNRDFIYMVFTIPNPEGAQYYKQELVVSMRARNYTRSGGNVQQHTDYLLDIYEITFIKMERRVYATPTAIPETTHTIWQGGIGSTYFWLADGYSDLAGYVIDHLFLPVSYGEYQDKKYLIFAIYSEQSNAHGEYDATTHTYSTAYRYTYRGIGVDVDYLANVFGGEFALDEDDDPNTPIDPDPGDNPPPGPGPQNKEYDPIPIPDMPGLTALGAGFITLYSPSKAVMNLFAAELYSDNILQIISNYFTNIQDMVAGLSIVPFFVPVSGFAKHRIGLFTSDVSMPVVASQFIDIDCGSVSVDRYYNNFLDQAGNTRLMLWLPYIGYQEINPDEVMGQLLSVKYRCDVLSGACVAFVSIGSGSTPSANVGRVIAQFTGNVINQVPVAAASYDNMVSSAINILTASVGIAAGAAIGGGAGLAAGAAKAAPNATAGAIGAQVGLGMAGTASNMIMAMKPNVVRNGTPGSTAGYMGVQKPYLIKIVPRSAVAPNHIQLKGYPSNYGGTLASLSGYCEVSEIQLNIDPSGTAPEVDEKTEIYSLLKGGVVI